MGEVCVVDEKHLEFPSMYSTFISGMMYEMVSSQNMYPGLGLSKRWIKSTSFFMVSRALSRFSCHNGVLLHLNVFEVIKQQLSGKLVV